MRTNSRKLQQGFSIAEILGSMALVTVISTVLIGALGPWMTLRQKLETDQKMVDLQQAILTYYDASAMAVEAQPAGSFGPFVRSTPSAGRCPLDTAAYAAMSNLTSGSSQHIARDGYANPWCVFVSNPVHTRTDGVDLWYRDIGFVSTGINGVLDPETIIAGDGTISAIGGDDRGFTVTGRDLQSEKIKETLRRLNRVSQLYETYFTNRFIGNAARDATIDYFSNTYDIGGPVASTGGAWRSAHAYLGSIGVASTDASTPWESNNLIELGNHNETQGTTTVRSPASTGTSIVPYTAVLRARLPSPAATPAYAVQTVIGNY